MNLTKIVLSLTAMWDVLHFDFIIVSHETAETPLASTILFRKYNCSDLNMVRPWSTNLIVLYKPENLSEFWRTFEEMALIHKGELESRSVRDSSVYHFLLWPLPAPNGHDLCSEIEAKFESRFFMLNSNVFTVVTDTKVGLIVFEVYDPSSGSICKELPGGSSIIEIGNKLSRRQDFRNAVITSTAAVQESTVLEVNYQEVNGTVVSATGSAVRIFQDLMDVLHFKGEYTRGDWVLINSKGTLYGVSVSQLNTGLADLYLTQTTLSPYRARGFNYLQPTFQDGLNAFLQQPPSSTVNDVHISPFQTSLWLTIFGTWILLSISVLAISVIQLEFGRGQPEFSKMDRLQEALIWAIGAGCTQGWYRLPKSTSLRIVLLCGALSGLVNFITYSGSIISSLTSEAAPIQTLVDLLASPLEIYVDQDSSTIRHIVQDLKNRSGRSTGFISSSVSTGLSSIVEKPSALFGFSRNLYLSAQQLNITAHRLCKSLSTIPIQKLPLHNGMLVPKWSPYRESFNYKIIQLKERGLNFRYSKTFMTESVTSCPVVTHTYREDLGIYDVFTAFAILIGGTACSVLVATIEKIVGKAVAMKRRT